MRNASAHAFPSDVPQARRAPRPLARAPSPGSVHRLERRLATRLQPRPAGRRLSLWANWNVGGLELRRRHRATRIQVGDSFVEQAVLEANPGPGQWWPRLWLELHDDSDLPGHTLDGVLSLGPVAHKTWSLQSVCT